MLRCRTILSALALTLFTVTGNAQYAWDIGVQGGFANYLGEIGGGDGEARDWIVDMKLDQTRWNSGVFIRYRADYNFALNFTVNYARLQGADSLVGNPNRFTRNLHFRNDIFEAVLLGEYYFFNQPDVGRTGRYLLDLKAYFFAGAGVFYNNPKARLGNTWYALQPLNTENLESPYSKIQPTFPVGIGMFYTFSRLHRFGWKFGWRYTLTDYIDDVSTVYPSKTVFTDQIAAQLYNRSHEVADNPLASELAQYFTVGGIRGNPDALDSYILTSFSYSYVIRGKSRSFGRRKNYLYGRRRGRMGKAKF